MENYYSVVEWFMTWLKRLYQGWLKFAHLIGRVNTVILLTLFYFLFLGAAKLVTVFLRKDLLDECLGDRASYWRKREAGAIPPENFLKPY